MPFWLRHLVLRQISSFLPARAPYRVPCLQGRSGKEKAKNLALPLPCLEEFTVSRTLKPKMNGLFLDLLKGSLSKVLQGELIFWGVGLQWVHTPTDLKLVWSYSIGGWWNWEGWVLHAQMRGFTFSLGEQIWRNLPFIQQWISLLLALSPRHLGKSFPEECFALRSPLPPEFPRGGRDSSSFSLELSYPNHMLTSVDEWVFWHVTK